MAIRLLNEATVEVIALLQRLSNTQKSVIILDVEMDDYHRIKNKEKYV